MKIAILISALYKHYYYYYYYYWMFFSGSTSLEKAREHNCREVSKHEHNSKWIKFLELPQSDKSRSRKNWTNSCSQFDPCCFTNWKFPHRITCLQNTNFKACFKRRTTAVLSWLDCSCDCSMKLAPLGFKRRI